MQNFIPHMPAGNRFVIDIGEISWYIQHLIQHFFVTPPTGLYVPNRLEPILTNDQPYWYQIPRIDSTRQTQQTWYHYDYQSVQSLEEIIHLPWDVVSKPDGLGSVVVSHQLVKYATLTPSFPYHGAKIMLDLINNLMNSTRGFMTERRLEIEEVVCQYTRDGVTLQHLEEDPHCQSLMAKIMSATFDVLDPIRHFLNANPFQMCELHVDALECVWIEQTGDFRIQEWHLYRSNGQWP